MPAYSRKQLRNRKTNRRRNSRRERKTRRHSGGAKTFTFHVELKGPEYPIVEKGSSLMMQMASHERQVKATVHSPEVAEKVIEMYKTHGPEEIIDVAHKGGSKYEITYKGNESRASLCDFDDDGNYPIVINGKEHIVIGHADY
jgi:hypothetical protein